MRRLLKSQALRSRPVIAALICVFGLLPFIAKPFNVDDPFYIYMARQIQHDPLRPYSFEINWSDTSRNVWERNEATFPPLMPAALAGLTGIFGESEIPLHLAWMLLAALAAASMAALAVRFTAWPLAATLLFLATPTFWVTATGLGLDVPMLAFFLASIVLLDRACNGERGDLALLSGVFAGFAILTKYSALCILGFLSVYELLVHGRLRLSWRAIGIAAAMFAAWCLHNLLVYGDIHFLRAFHAVGRGLTLHKAIASVTFWAGCLPFCLFLLPAFVRSIRLRLFTIDGPMLFLILWLAAGTWLFVWVEPWAAGRYLILAGPPAALILARCAEVALRRARIWLAVSVFLTACIGASVAAADYAWAAQYRDFFRLFSTRSHDEPLPADVIPKPYRWNPDRDDPEASAVFTEIFGRFTAAGHFGFQYYAGRAGVRSFFDRNTAYPPGTIVVVAHFADPPAGLATAQPPAGYALLKPSDYPELGITPPPEYLIMPAPEGRWPVRVMNPLSPRAGFYSSFWGMLPYSFSRAPLEFYKALIVKEKSPR